MIAMPPFSTGNCVCMGLFSFHVFSQLGGPVCGSVLENCVCMRLLFRAMRSRSSAVRFAASTPGGRGILAKVVCRCSRCLCLSQRRPKRRCFLSAKAGAQPFLRPALVSAAEGQSPSYCRGLQFHIAVMSGSDVVTTNGGFNGVLQQSNAQIPSPAPSGPL